MMAPIGFTGRKNKKRTMPKRTETKIAVPVQSTSELDFDRETISKATKVPHRTVSDIINGKGCWTFTVDFNELQDRTGFTRKNAS
jgi:hypothetical protein